MPDNQELTTIKRDEQKRRVNAFFDESKPWQGDLYQPQDDYFARVIVRRKEYAVEMLKALPESGRGKALDIGCGSGVYLKELLALGFDAVGMDLSQEMLEVSRQNNDPLRGAQLHLVGGDVEHLPFKDAEFDLVLCIGVMGYLLSDEQALSEIRRIVKPGGALLLNLTNMYSLSDADYVLRRKVKQMLRPSSVQPLAGPPYALPSPWMLKHRKYHFKSYNLRKYERIMKHYGFRKLDGMTYGFEFRVLRRLRILPLSLLNGIEIFLEKFFRRFSVPVLSSTGWVYTGLYRRLP